MWRAQSARHQIWLVTLGLRFLGLRQPRANLGPSLGLEFSIFGSRLCVLKYIMFKQLGPD